jgi:hypothetical protein
VLAASWLAIRSKRKSGQTSRWLLLRTTTSSPRPRLRGCRSVGNAITPAALTRRDAEVRSGLHAGVTASGVIRLRPRGAAGRVLSRSGCSQTGRLLRRRSDHAGRRQRRDRSTTNPMVRALNRRRSYHAIGAAGAIGRARAQQQSPVARRTILRSGRRRCSRWPDAPKSIHVAAARLVAAFGGQRQCRRRDLRGLVLVRAGKVRGGFDPARTRRLAACDGRNVNVHGCTRGARASRAATGYPANGANARPSI